MCEVVCANIFMLQVLIDRRSLPQPANVIPFRARIGDSGRKKGQVLKEKEMPYFPNPWQTFSFLLGKIYSVPNQVFGELCQFK